MSDNLMHFAESSTVCEYDISIISLSKRARTYKQNIVCLRDRFTTAVCYFMLGSLQDFCNMWKQGSKITDFEAEECSHEIFVVSFAVSIHEDEDSFGQDTVRLAGSR
jgi:hypothetical protein